MYNTHEQNGVFNHMRSGRLTFEIETQSSELSYNLYYTVIVRSMNNICVLICISIGGGEGFKYIIILNYTTLIIIYFYFFNVRSENIIYNT